jgi:hypothetical protein
MLLSNGQWCRCSRVIELVKAEGRNAKSLIVLGTNIRSGATGQTWIIASARSA